MKPNALMNIICYIFSCFLLPLVFCSLVVCYTNVVENTPYAGRWFTFFLVVTFLSSCFACYLGRRAATLRL